MNEIDNHAGDQQNPEVLKKQIEVISRTASYTLDKEASAIGRFFPDAAEKLRERQREAILEEHFDYNIKAMRIFKKRQLQSLETFLGENLERVIGDEALKTQQFNDRNLQIATRSYISSVFNINLTYSDFLAQIKDLEDENHIKQIEEQIKRSLDKLLALAEKKFDEYMKKIEKPI